MEGGPAFREGVETPVEVCTWEYFNQLTFYKSYFTHQRKPVHYKANITERPTKKNGLGH